MISSISGICQKTINNCEFFFPFNLAQMKPNKAYQEFELDELDKNGVSSQSKLKY